MFTFINAVVNEKEQKESTIFAQCENVKNTVFSEPIVIDPYALLDSASYYELYF